MSVNKVILLGHVCNDPAIKVFDNGGEIAQFQLATNKKGYTTKSGVQVPDKAEFHYVVSNLLGISNIVEKYVKKGDKIYIEGELRNRSYDDQAGIKRYVTEVYINFIELLTKKGNNDVQNIPPPEPEPQPENIQNIDDDLPF